MCVAYFTYGIVKWCTIFKYYLLIVLVPCCLCICFNYYDFFKKYMFYCHHIKLTLTSKFLVWFDYLCYGFHLNHYLLECVLFFLIYVTDWLLVFYQVYYFVILHEIYILYFYQSKFIINLLLLFRGMCFFFISVVSLYVIYHVLLTKMKHNKWFINS